MGIKCCNNANIQFVPFIRSSLYFFFLFSRIIVLFNYLILHGFLIPFLCFICSCQHFLLHFFHYSLLLLPFLSLSFVTSSFVTFSLLYIAYFRFLNIFYVYILVCIDLKAFSRRLLHRTQKYTRRSEVFGISLSTPY